MRVWWVCLLAWALPVWGADPVPIAIAPASLTFAYQSGSNLLTPQAVYITGQNSTIAATRPADQKWVVLGATGGTFTGTSPTVIPVSIDPSGLGVGNYSTAITIKTPSGTATIPVSLQISGFPVLMAFGTSDNAGMLVFGRTQPGVLPLQAIIVVASNGTGPIISGVPTAPWMSVRTAGSELDVTLIPSKASPGLNAAAITVSTVSAVANPTLSVPVLFLSNGGNSVGPLAFNPASVTANLLAGANATYPIAVTGGAFTASSDSSWLQVTAGTSLTATVNTAGLAAGSYSGTISVVSGAVVQMVPVNLTVTPGSPPVLSAIGNAASYAAGGIAPGEIVILGGTNLGPPDYTFATADSSGNVQRTVAGVQALFNGTAAPLVYAGPRQVAAVVPYEVAGSSTATVQVTVGGLGSNVMTVPVTAVLPGVFSADSSGSGPGAILNSDASFNSPANPAARGTTVVLFATGEGQTNPAGATGKITVLQPAPPLTPAPAQPVTVTIDGQPATVMFAGEAPGDVAGVLQVNAIVPAGVRTGQVPVVVAVGGVKSQDGLTVSVK